MLIHSLTMACGADDNDLDISDNSTVPARKQRGLTVLPIFSPQAP